MPTQGLSKVLAARLAQMAQSGRLKGDESVLRAIIPAQSGSGKPCADGSFARNFIGTAVVHATDQ